MTPWEVARKAESLLVRVYKEGLSSALSEEIAQLVTTDCVGGPADMIWDVVVRVRDDPSYGSDYVKRVVHQTIGPFQEVPALAAHVRSMCCMSLALSALEKCDMSAAREHLELGLEQDRRTMPTSDEVKRLVDAVTEWAENHGV